MVEKEDEVNYLLVGCHIITELYNSRNLGFIFEMGFFTSVTSTNDFFLYKQGNKPPRANSSIYGTFRPLKVDGAY